MEKFEPDFIKNKYWDKPEFRDATDISAKRTKIREGETISQKPQERIENYLERFEEITDRENPKEQEKGIRAIERLVQKKYIIKPENISDEYIKGILLGNEAEALGYERDAIKNEEIRKTILTSLEKKIHSNLEDYKIPQEIRKEMENMIIIDQESRMKQWLEYLTSLETKNIPISFRYWAFAEVLKQGTLILFVENTIKELPKQLLTSQNSINKLSLLFLM